MCTKVLQNHKGLCPFYIYSTNQTLEIMWRSKYTDTTRGSHEPVSVIWYNFYLRFTNVLDFLFYASYSLFPNEDEFWMFGVNLLSSFAVEDLNQWQQATSETKTCSVFWKENYFNQPSQTI